MMSQMSIITESENESCVEPLLKIQAEINEQLRDTETKISKQLLSYDNKVNTLETELLNKINHINTLYNTLSDSIALLTNRLDRLNGYESFTLRTTDQLVSHEIRITNATNELNKAIQKYDKIYVDNLLLPGYIGEYCKYKNVPAFFDDVLTQLNVLTLAKDKSNIDLKSYKDKLDIIIKNFNLQVSNNTKSNMKYVNDVTEKNKKLFNEKFDEIAEKINEMKLENAKYAIELKSKSIDLSKEWNTMINIKNEIFEKYDEKVNEFYKGNISIVNSFNEVKEQFEHIRHNFKELSEFIKDVRFRKNLGGDVKKREIKTLIKKISFTNKNNKKQSQSQEHSISSKIRNRFSSDNNKKIMRNNTTNKTLISSNNEDDDISSLAQSLYENNNNHNKCDIFLETNDNIIHELAAELEQSAKKISKDKIKEMTSLLHPRKLNLNKIIDDNINTQNNNNKPSSNNNSSLNSTNISFSKNKIFSKHLDSKKLVKELEKKVQNLEIFTKEKFLELNSKLDIIFKTKSNTNFSESNANDNKEHFSIVDAVPNHRKHKSFYCSSPSFSTFNKIQSKVNKKMSGKENENKQLYYIQGAENKAVKKQIINCDNNIKHQDEVKNMKWVPLQVVLSNRTTKNENNKISSSNMLLDKNYVFNGENL